MEIQWPLSPLSDYLATVGAGDHCFVWSIPPLVLSSLPRSIFPEFQTHLIAVKPLVTHPSFSKLLFSYIVFSTIVSEFFPNLLMWMNILLPPIPWCPRLNHHNNPTLPQINPTGWGRKHWTNSNIKLKVGSNSNPFESLKYYLIKPFTCFI